MAVNASGASAGREVLDAMMTGFDQFENVLKDGARQRKEKDDARLQTLRQQILTVESEVRRENTDRIESAKALQGWTETQVSTLRSRLEGLLQQRHAETVSRIDALVAKVGALELQFEADKVAVLEEVDWRNKELVAALAAFKHDFEAERASRALREQALHASVGAAEHEAKAQWDEERGTREQVYMRIKARVEEAVEARDKVDSKFQKTTYAEIAGLKNAIEAEAVSREAEDAAMAGHVTAYVKKLQASLAVLGTDDDRF